MSDPDPPGAVAPDPPVITPDSSESMIVDPAESSIIVDTALEPAIVPFPISSPFVEGPAHPSIPTTDAVEQLPNVGAPYWTLHPLLKVGVHSHTCTACIAFIDHQDTSDPSWALVQDQLRIHHRAEFNAGVSRGLAFASERIVTAEDVRRRAEDNVQRLTRQRNIARESEAAAQDRISELQSQLATIRLEHADLVRDHAQTQQALDRALAPSRGQSPRDTASPISSQHRRSPRPEKKKRKRSSPQRSGAEPHRGRDSRPAPSGLDPPSWTATHMLDIRGAQWNQWVPISHDDVYLVFNRATTDAHAADRIRILAVAADDVPVANRTSVMRFLVQQWHAHRDELATHHTDPPAPSFVPEWGGRGTGQRDTRRGNTTRQTAPPSHTPSSRAPSSSQATRTQTTSRAPHSFAPIDNAAIPNEWTTVKHGKQRASHATADTTAAAPAPPAKTKSNAVKPHQAGTPAYESPISEWTESIRLDPSKCPRGVPMHPDNSLLRGQPVVRLLERHIEIRLNGPNGREKRQRASRGHWVNRTTQLFSIRGLYGRVLHKINVQPTGHIPTVRPYLADTRNLSIEDVARHFASNGYQPRSLSITEFEEYACGRRNVIEGRPYTSTSEWSSYPRLAEMNTVYPPVHAASQANGPPRNLYANMSLDFRRTGPVARAATPEGPTLASPSSFSGSMSPDFPAHYVPPTPHFVPISDDVALPLPTEANSWADDLPAVNNSSGTSSSVIAARPTTEAAQEALVNNIATRQITVEPASLPLPASRSATPMDATE
ncbi:hypothetical protein FA95DRAFT_1613313 [Auriscalpium vulgare]|uniref:Uncharacterized protein n=1 Tax=Auriscalpium vulgare TaxID=40419 RepID=A0ACB8R384_9AGAM|nr:hypothetical protein FA95DRAFT_1613313 [Auriscalpium vulgare]